MSGTRPRPARRRRSGCLGVIAGVVLVIVIAAILGSAGHTSNNLPPGKWGRVISCLQSHPLFSVSDAITGNAPTRKTASVVVLGELNGHFLAYVGDNALGADDLTGTQGIDVNLRSGPIHYGFFETADAQNKSDIAACVP